MVIEFLTFSVPPAELDAWLDMEARHWSRFLESQPGFVRKEMWQASGDPSAVHAVIWWESVDHWNAVDEADLDAVAAAMGPHERHADCVSFELLRVG